MKFLSSFANLIVAYIGDIHSDTVHSPTQGSASRALKILLSIACVLGVLIATELYLLNRSATLVPTHGTRVEFTSTGSPAWYEFSSRDRITFLSSIGSLNNGTLAILEAVPSIISGELIVLARASGVPGISLGTVGGDNSFTSLSAGVAEKADLAAQGDIVVFSQIVPAAVHATSTTLAINGKQVEVRNEPSNEDTQAAHALFAFDLKKKESPRELGSGRAARFLTDGSVIALAPEGLVRIMLTSGKRETLVPHAAADAQGSTISKDGSVVVFADPAKHTIAFYATDAAHPLRYQFRGILPNASYTDAAFIDNTFLVTLTPDNAMYLYRVPTESNPIVRPEAHFTVVQPSS